MTDQPKGAYDAGSKLVKLKGRDYLEVKWRIAWLRFEHPDAVIETRLHLLDTDARSAVFRAKVTTPTGGSATGWGEESFEDFGDYLEKAETKALGRALAALGYGTQFAGELDEDVENAPADSPVKRTAAKSSGSPGGASEAQVKAMYAVARNELQWTDDELEAYTTATFQGHKPGEMTKSEASGLLDRMKGKNGQPRPEKVPTLYQSPAPAPAADRPLEPNTGDRRLAAWLVAHKVDGAAHPGFALVDKWLRQVFKGVGITEFRTAPQAQRDEIMKAVENEQTARWLAEKLAAPKV